MTIKSKIPRSLAILLTNKFIKKEILDANVKNYGFYAKETKNLGDAYLKYPNEEFWNKMNLGFQLNSFAYFKMPQGADELEKQWRLFQFTKELDKKSNSSILKEDRVVETPIIKKEQTIIEWAD